MSTRTDFSCLFNAASSQQGYFTRSQADACGFGTDLLTYHTRSGKFDRVHRGIYRLRDYPTFSQGEIVAAWLAVGKESAVVSHESALDLLGLSDVIPDAIHLTVPRSRRNLPRLPGVQIHTTSRTLSPTDITTREGIRLTSPARTIIDAADSGTAPDQIERAVRQALHRGLTTPQRLRAAAKGRSLRVRTLIERTLENAQR